MRRPGRAAVSARGRHATIKFGVGIDPHYVLVTIVSAEGVRLQLSGVEPVDEFVLLFRA